MFFHCTHARKVDHRRDITIRIFHKLSLNFGNGKEAFRLQNQATMIVPDALFFTCCSASSWLEKMWYLQRLHSYPGRANESTPFNTSSFYKKYAHFFCMMFITPSLEIVSINAGQRQNCNSRWRFSSSYSVYFIIGSGLSSGRAFGHQNLSLNLYDMIQSFERFAYGTYNIEGHHRKK